MGIALKLDEMSLADKLEAMETLWDDLCHRAREVAIPEWHHDVLGARAADVHKENARFTEWDVAKENIRESLK